MRFSAATRVHDALVSSADTSVTLAAWDTGGLTVGLTVGRLEPTAIAAIATRFEDVTGADLAGTVSWAMFR